MLFEFLFVFCSFSTLVEKKKQMNILKQLVLIHFILFFFFSLQCTFQIVVIILSCDKNTYDIKNSSKCTHEEWYYDPYYLTNKQLDVCYKIEKWTEYSSGCAKSLWSFHLEFTSALTVIMPNYLLTIHVVINVAIPWITLPVM